MSRLVSPDPSLEKRRGENISVNFLMEQEIEDLKLRDRKLPEKPKKQEVPPDSPKMKVQSSEVQRPKLEARLPDLDLSDTTDTGVATGGLSGSQDKEAIPSFRIDPMYPRSAALQGTEGFVVLKFDITESGTTKNISVLQARPPQIFNSSAIQALRKWKYKPKVEGGKAVVQKNLKVRLDFKLEGEE